jgi:hypothetical protein
MNKKQVSSSIEEYKNRHDYDGDVMVLDGFEEAFVGISSNGENKPRACYDRSKMIDIMVEAMGSDQLALEYFNDNIYSVCLGEGAPLFVD